MSQFMSRYCYYYLYIVNILIMLGINSEEIKQQQMRGTDVPHRMVWDNITLSFIKDIVTLPEDAPTLKSTYWNLTNPLGETYKVGAYTNTLQDHYVLILSNDKSGGYYVDLATNHYKLGSNTYALDIFNNWQGICIEPNPIHHIQILSHRRCELFVNPVSSKPGEEVLFRFENPGDAGLGGLGGIVGEQFDNKGSNAGDVHLITTTLTSILDQANAPRKIDYLSLDVEGAEFYVLKDFNYTKYTFSILTIERPNEDSHYVLIKNGYKFITLLSDYGECLYLHNTTNNFEYWVNKYHHIGVTPHWHNKKKEYLLLSQIF